MLKCSCGSIGVNEPREFSRSGRLPLLLMEIYSRPEEVGSAIAVRTDDGRATNSIEADVGRFESRDNCILNCF